MKNRSSGRGGEGGVRECCEGGWKKAKRLVGEVIIKNWRKSGRVKEGNMDEEGKWEKWGIREGDGGRRREEKKGWVG